MFRDQLKREMLSYDTCQGLEKSGKRGDARIAAKMRLPFHMVFQDAETDRKKSRLEGLIVTKAMVDRYVG